MNPKQPYSFDEILLILEKARMDDESDRLRELWAEKQREIDGVRDDAAFLINQRMKDLREEKYDAYD